VTESEPTPIVLLLLMGSRRGLALLSLLRGSSFFLPEDFLTIDFDLLATDCTAIMSNRLEFEVLAVPDHASIKTSRSRRSIVTSLRSKTSRLFGRTLNDTNTAQEISHPSRASPVRSKRRWFNSVGARFHRQDRTVLESSDKFQDARVELSTSPGTANPPSPRERSPSPSPIGRRPFGRRRRVPSFPTQFRRPSASTFRRSSSSLSEKGKENLVELAGPVELPANAANTGSWSSFRSGVQRAVRGKWSACYSVCHCHHHGY